MFRIFELAMKGQKDRVEVPDFKDYHSTSHRELIWLCITSLA